VLEMLHLAIQAQRLGGVGCLQGIDCTALAARSAATCSTSTSALVNGRLLSEPTCRTQ
jgi:hypothetical protein